MGCGCKKKKEEVQQPVPQTPDELLSQELKEWNEQNKITEDKTEEHGN